MKRIKIGKKRKRRKPYFVRPEQKRRKSERKLFGKLMRGAVLCLSNGLELLQEIKGYTTGQLNYLLQDLM